MKRMLRTVYLSIMLSVLSSCASNTNMADGGSNPFGGGYRVREITPGVYRIVANTNAGPVVNYQAARGMWEERADETCGKSQYRELKTKEYWREKRGSTAFLGLVKYIITVKRGYVVCESSDLSDEEVIDLIAGRV